MFRDWRLRLSVAVLLLLARPGQTPIGAQARSMAAIAGRVSDDLGDPVIGARVTVERVIGTATATVASGDSDDRGEFRIALPSTGSFVVAVTTIGRITAIPIGTGNQRALTPQRYKIYFPRADSVERATPVSLAAGDVRDDIDFVVSSESAVMQPFSVAAGGGDGIIVAAFNAVPRGGAGVIRGRVVAIDGRPLANAQVALQYSGVRFAQEVMRADRRGAFEFRNLLPGEYRVTASKPGYSANVDPPSSATAPLPLSARTVTVVRGREPESVDVALAPFGSISGVVTDPDGAPMPDVVVQLLAMQYERGRRQLVPAGASRRTDDQGHYRLFGLRAGTFVVSASAGATGSRNVAGYVPSYYPDAERIADAQPIVMAQSESKDGVDVTIVRGKTATVSGRILDASGAATSGGTVTLRPSQRSGVLGLTASARLLGDGRFEFPNVASGAYVIQADRGRKNASTEGEFGALPIEVNGEDISGLTLRMNAGATLSGAVVLDTTDGRTVLPAGLTVSAVPTDYDLAPWNNYATSEINAEGRFTLAGLQGPRRLIVDHLPDGWLLREMRAAGIDITDRPVSLGSPAQPIDGVEIVLTNRGAVMTGRVTDQQGGAVNGAGVIVFSTDRQRWFDQSRFVRTTATTDGGAFSLNGLPAGSYYVAAVQVLPSGRSWQDPQYLEALRFVASTITVSSETRPVELRLAR